MSMDSNKLKFIQGKAEAGKVAIIKFMDSVDAWSTSSFKEEFNWLENWIRPSKIKILINTEGGDVIRGMDVFSTIINSTIPTECIVEGIAASMGSVILAAGNVSKMRDYGLIMIHNPFYQGEENEAPDPGIIAFTNQLRTIYKQRWGFSDEKIATIMDGKPDEDGTFIDAEEAVKLGIITKENVIVTTKQEKAAINAAINGIKSKAKIAEVFAVLNINSKIEPNKPLDDKTSNLNQEGDNAKGNLKLKSMNEELATVAASLSMDKKATTADILAKVTELNKVGAKVVDLEKAKSDLTIANSGLTASLSNVNAELATKTEELTSATAELNGYKAKELAAKKAEREAYISAAITAGKFKAEAKEQWLAFAESNFEACKVSIESIISAAKISDSITDTAGKIVDGKQLTEEEVAEAEKATLIKNAVGGEFEFQKINK